MSRKKRQYFRCLGACLATFLYCPIETDNKDNIGDPTSDGMYMILNKTVETLCFLLFLYFQIQHLHSHPQICQVSKTP